VVSLDNVCDVSKLANEMEILYRNIADQLHKEAKSKQLAFLLDKLSTENTLLLDVVVDHKAFMRVVRNRKGKVKIRYRIMFGLEKFIVNIKGLFRSFY
jgi:hypothetical protein